MKIKYLVSLILVSINFAGFGQYKFFVSPSGKDFWAGSMEKPFKTINRAKEVVRTKIDNSKEDIYVFLRGGFYNLDNTIIFSAEDGGKGEQKICYKAYNEEKPVITGGIRITGWVPDKNGIIKAKVNGLKFRQLYVNGEKAVRSRQPDKDFFRLTGWDLKGHNLILPSSLIKDWNNFQDVEMVLQQYWSEGYLHLDTFQNFTGGAELAYASINEKQKRILFDRSYPQKQDNAAFHFENAYEFINEPGEWYLNRHTDELFYKPQTGADIEKCDISVPKVEQLIEISGTSETPVKNLFFEGITFTESNWDFPTGGSYLDMQGGMYNSTSDTLKRPPSAVHIQNAENIVFEKNVFRNLGATAIDLEFYTKNCQIKGNIIQNIAGNGIVVGGFKLEDQELVDYNFVNPGNIDINDEISNNYITQTGREYFGTCGITAGFSAGLIIENNVLKDMPYSGISLGWGWTKNRSSLHDNLIAYNDISDCVNLLCDGGGIYTLSMQPGTKIIGNYIHDMSRSKWAGEWPISAIYNDEGSGGTLENPMLLQANITPIWSEGVKQLYFHKTGIILLNSNTFYVSKEEIEKAGIGPEFRDFIYNNIHKK